MLDQPANNSQHADLLSRTLTRSAFIFYLSNEASLLTKTSFEIVDTNVSFIRKFIYFFSKNSSWWFPNQDQNSFRFQWLRHSLCVCVVFVSLQPNMLLAPSEHGHYCLYSFTNVRFMSILSNHSPGFHFTKNFCIKNRSNVKLNCKRLRTTWFFVTSTLVGHSKSSAACRKSSSSKLKEPSAFCREQASVSSSVNS